MRSFLVAFALKNFFQLIETFSVLFFKVFSNFS